MDTIKAIGYEELFTRYKNNIYRFAFVNLRNKKDAEEATMLSFIEYINCKQDVRDMYEAMLCLFKCSDKLCTRMREKKELNKASYIYSKNIVNERDDELEEFLTEVLNIDYPSRSVIYLYNFEDMEINEISHVLGIDNSEVKEILILSDPTTNKVGGRINER